MSSVRSGSPILLSRPELDQEYELLLPPPNGEDQIATNTSPYYPTGKYAADSEPEAPAPCLVIGVPVASLRILAVEFNERLGFYGAVFSLTTYMTAMLGLSSEMANFIINVMYTVSPMSSLAGAHYADNPLVGRAKVLLLSGSTYALGLCLLTLSAVPAVWTDFPTAPSVWTYVFFYTGVTVLCFGYGPLKVCTAPLMADAVDKNHPDHAAVISSLFRWLYFVTNLGAMIGMIACPFLRSVEGPIVNPGTTSETGSAFYASLGACAAASVLGVFVFASGMSTYPKPEIAVRGRPLFLTVVTGALCNLVSKPRTRPPGESWIYEYMQTVEGNDQYCATTRAAVTDVVTTIEACRLFCAFPLYWLIGNQSSTNLILQASWLQRPPWVPPEAYNNISTVATLLLIPVFDRVVFPLLYPSRPPPLVGRMTVGFLLAALTMVCCGLLQFFLHQNGVFKGTEYHLSPGGALIPAWWLFPIYIMQAVCGILVDTAAIEAAYVLAPQSAKSLVGSLYLVASAGAGILGILCSPLARPEWFMALFFGMAVVQVVIAGAFYATFWSIDRRAGRCGDALEAVCANDAAT